MREDHEAFTEKDPVMGISFNLDGSHICFFLSELGQFGKRQRRIAQEVAAMSTPGFDQLPSTAAGDYI